MNLLSRGGDLYALVSGAEAGFPDITFAMNSTALSALGRSRGCAGARPRGERERFPNSHGFGCSFLLCFSLFYYYCFDDPEDCFR